MAYLTIAYMLLLCFGASRFEKDAAGKWIPIPRRLPEHGGQTAV